MLLLCLYVQLQAVASNSSLDYSPVENRPLRSQNTASDHSSITIIIQLDYTHKIRTYLKHSIFISFTMSQTCHGHSGPNAVFLPNYGHCNPQPGNVSLCCEIGQTCLTNGLCVSQSGVYYSGGCTDSTYQAAICPKFCTSGGHCAMNMYLHIDVRIRGCQLGGPMSFWCCSQGRGLLLLCQWDDKNLL